MDTEQFKLEADPEPHQEVLEFENSLFYQNDNTPIGWLRHLALEKGDWKFTATHKTGDIFTLTHSTGLSFVAELKAVKGQQKGTYSIRGCVTRAKGTKHSFFDGVNLHGSGKGDWKLRPAQLGAVHSLLAHWSLSTEPATVVLPTGTGKTETMLVTTLVDRATRTLVIVPTRELKDQIAEKFMSWGMLRRLGVLPDEAPNPKVLVLRKTITESSHLEYINSADVVVATPALLARAPAPIKSELRKAFSHVSSTKRIT